MLEAGRNETRIPVDLLNPGQVFACLGLLELAEILLGAAEGGFDWSDPAQTWFRLAAAGQDNPVAAALDFLAEAEVRAVVPVDTPLSTASWGVPIQINQMGASYPFPVPGTPATLPALLSANGYSVAIDHWGDVTERDNVKFWAGSGGYPGAALLRDSLHLARANPCPWPADDPFSVAAPQTSSFRFDWRRDYVPLEVGFAPNAHSALTMVGYPLVEALAAIGMSHARPVRVNKLLYRYGAIGVSAEGRLHPPLLLRAALGCSQVGMMSRHFTMRLDWPGQENQARCIIDVRET